MVSYVGLSNTRICSPVLGNYMFDISSFGNESLITLDTYLYSS